LQIRAEFMNVKKFTTEIEGKELSIELGSLAQLANGSALVKFGQTVVLATAVMLKEPSEKNYLPLMVDYEERFYAAGKIKGSRWIKREGRPTDEAILTGRLVDRAIRPLFNGRIRNDIQIILTVLSFDGENDPSIPALIGASMAVSISDIPWNGPVAGISIGQTDRDWVITPTLSAKANSGSEIFIAGIEKDKEIVINMIEGQTPQIAENNILEGIDFARKYIKELLDFQKKIIDETKPEKKDLKLLEIDESIKKEIMDFLEGKIEKAIYISNKKARLEGLGKLQEELFDFIREKYPEEKKKLSQASEILEEEIDKIVHENILKHNKRPDGRKMDELREITAAVGVLPRTHGSGLFKRGDTQILSLVTLGSPGAEQYLDQMELAGKKRFMHDYNFPPYSVGDIGPMRGPGRREIGHGALAEKALLPIIPSKEEFPYTIRIVSEVLSSNGSSSMGSVCGSTLALLDTGVPIKANVSGIAMGLMTNGEDYKILTDIQGPEDHHGDMDFKIAGTKEGITALQMDVKINGVNLDILRDILKQAKKARIEILDVMEKTIKAPRPELSPLAPRVYSLQINPSKIGLVIGPGGKTINEIVAETGAVIDIEEDGKVFITSDNAEMAKKAMGKIKTITREVKLGETFCGKVVKITEFGAFVELYPKQDGLLHISELGPKVRRVEDVIREGDMLDVKVKRIDEAGKVSLTLQKKPKKI